MPQFYTVLTDIGQAKMANAIALGTTIEIAAMAVGDGGGTLPNPDSTREALVNELRRAAINRVEVDADNPSWLIVEQVLPPDDGGWTIREVGIFDTDGDLIGYGNYPETYKPTLDQGSGRTLTIRMVLEVSHTAAVTLRVDPSVVLATREYVDSEIDKHAQSRNHPVATESAKGMITLSTEEEAFQGDESSKAMSSLRVHQAFRRFGLGSSLAATVTDADLINRTGVYGTAHYGSYSTLNVPVSGAGNTIWHHEWDENAATQVFVSFGSDGMFFRRKANGDWNPWVMLWDKNNLTPEKIGAFSSEGGEIEGLVKINNGNDILLSAPELNPDDPGDVVFLKSSGEALDRIFWSLTEGALSTVGGKIWDAGNNDMVSAICPFPLHQPPSGWLKCNGAAISRDLYSNLFSKIGTMFGAGDGSTTFNLPDLRGEFVRAFDDARGVDLGRSLGSHQMDEFRSHSHGGVPARYTDGDRGTVSSTFSVDDMGSTFSSGGNETRPRNVALLYCIKY